MTFFFFNDTATTEIYTLSLHDALPIFSKSLPGDHAGSRFILQNASVALPTERRIVLLGCESNVLTEVLSMLAGTRDRKSTRLNSSHLVISYAVFCLKKKIRAALAKQRH